MISASLTGDADVIAMLDGLDGKLRDALREGLARAANLLRNEIVQGRLSGQVLHARSGRLQRSITVTDTIDSGGAISIGVSSDAPYAMLHEYGFRGSEAIRAQVRRITHAFGRPIAEKAINVRPYSRSVDYPERSFMRSALRDLEASGAIRAEIDAAIGKALA